MNVETTSDSLRIQISLSVPLPTVWKLITEAEHVANWWGDHVTFDSRPGGKLIEKWFNGQREVVTTGEVTRFASPSTLEMTWADDDWPGDTKVFFELSEDGEHTRLILEHSGWFIHASEKRQTLIDEHANGWSNHLASLRGYATKLSNSR